MIVSSHILVECKDCIMVLDISQCLLISVLVLGCFLLKRE